MTKTYTAEGMGSYLIKPDHLNEDLQNQAFTYGEEEIRTYLSEQGYALASHLLEYGTYSVMHVGGSYENLETQSIYMMTQKSNGGLSENSSACGVLAQMELVLEENEKKLYDNTAWCIAILPSPKVDVDGNLSYAEPFVKILAGSTKEQCLQKLREEYPDYIIWDELLKED